jgi:hypothetical protein
MIWNTTRMPAQPPIDVLSVLTLEYSGSTILAMVTAMHPRIVTLGEGQKLYWKAIRKIRYDAPAGAHDCSCGEPFATCPFWQEIAAKVQERVPPHVATLDFPGFRMYHRDGVNRWAHRRCLAASARGRQVRLLPFLRRRYHDVAAANAAVVDVARELTGTDVYLDTGKHPVATALMASSPLRRGKLVHLIRDGRGQVESTMRHHADLDFEGACRRWVETTQQHVQILEMFPGRYETVRYEDFCADPVGVARRLWTLCGLNPDEARIDFSDAPQHVMGNSGVRFGTVDEIRDRQDWRRRLTADQLDRFEQIAGPLHRRMGYE